MGAARMFVHFDDCHAGRRMLHSNKTVYSVISFDSDVVVGT